MENMRYPIKLDMNDTGALKTSIRLKQGDSAITLILRIYKDGVNVFSVDDIPSIVFHRPDGTSVIGECLTAEGQYTYQFAGNELQYSGQIRADVKFDLYTARESTVTFLFECVTDTIPRNVTGAGIYVNSLKDIKDYLDSTVTKIEQELEAFDIQTVLDAVNEVERVKAEVEDIREHIPDIPTVTDNYLATEKGTALDAVLGKDLNERVEKNGEDIVALNENKADKNSVPDVYVSNIGNGSETVLDTLKNANSNFPNLKFICGTLNPNSTRAVYEGFKSGNYSTFLVHSYDGNITHVINYNGTWSSKKVTTN